MKYILSLTLILTVFAVQGMAQTGNGYSAKSGASYVLTQHDGIDTFILNHYYNQAVLLSLKEMQNNQEQYQNVVNAPENLILKYLKAFQSVKATGLNCLDTIMGASPFQDNIQKVSKFIGVVDTFGEEWVSKAIASASLLEHPVLGKLTIELTVSISRIDTLDDELCLFKISGANGINTRALNKYLSPQKNGYALVCDTDCYEFSDCPLQIGNNIRTIYRNKIAYRNGELIFSQKVCDKCGIVEPSQEWFFSFTFDTTCNAKLLRTHYADYTTEVAKVTEQHTVCFPNPVSNYLHLQGGNKVGSFYQVYALSGALQSSGQIVNNQIDVSTLPNGVYILKTRDDNGTLQHHKFVKKGN